MVKFILCQGIGFSPGTISWMPTLGFSIGEAVVNTFHKMFVDRPTIDYNQGYRNG